MNEPKAISPQRRLQELLAIPERQRTDAQWDEINELEITLTPANREMTPAQGVRQNTTVPAGHLKPSTETQRKNPGRKLHKRFPKVDAPRRTPRFQ